MRNRPISLELTEADRQLVMMALAALSLTFPGFDAALNEIALRIDNEKNGRGEMFDAMRKLRADCIFPSHLNEEAWSIIAALHQSGEPAAFPLLKGRATNLLAQGIRAQGVCGEPEDEKDPNA